MTRTRPNLWLYNETVIDKFWTIPDNAHGFTYILTNCVNNKKYIGKKSFWKWRFKKGKRTKYRTKSEWFNYTGSSNHVDLDIKEFGIKSFRRDMLKICNSSLELSYQEEKLLFIHEAIERDDYYNQSVGGRYYSSNLFPLTATK